MSVIQRIRDRGAWIVFAIIALALVAFILQDSSLKRGSFFGSSTSVGSINGEAVDRTEFQNNVTYLEGIFKQRGQDMPQGMLNTQAWNFTVQQTLLKQEADKLGIGFTEKEMADVLFGSNPPQWMQQAFTDPKTGVYDANVARQQFAQLKKSSNQEQTAQVQKLLEQTQQQALYSKYASLVSGAAYIPKWMAEKMNADNNSTAKASYVFVPYSTINDSSVTVSDDDISAYINKHKTNFERDEETRTIQYVSFAETPSATDSATVKDGLQAIKPAFAANPDAAQFVVAKNSDIPEETYTTRNGFKDANADTLLNLPVGNVYGPYLDNGKYVLAKLVGKRTAPDSVKVRHILIMTQQRGQDMLPDSIAKKRIDSIAAAIQGGANFDSMVQKYSDDGGSKGTKGEYSYSYSQFGTISKEFAETAFFTPVGTKKTVKVSNSGYAGYHYIEVLDQKNVQDAFTLAYLAKSINASNETVSNASTMAAKFAAETKNQKSFETNTKKYKLTSANSQEIKKEDYSIGMMGAENRELIRWIYSNDVGDVSDPFALGDQYIVALITADDKAGVTSAHTARTQVEPLVRNERKAKTIINTKLKGNTLEDVAKSAGVSVQQADSLSFQSPAVPGLGFEPKLLGAAFNKSLSSKISSPIAGMTGVFVVKSNGVAALSSTGISAEQVQESMRRQLQQQQGNGGVFEALRKSVSIKDNRSDF